MQLVTPETHMISDIESDNGSNEQQEENVNTGLGMVSSIFAWQNRGSFPTSQEMFFMCMVPSLTLLKWMP
jgi:hypothetical protein